MYNIPRKKYKFNTDSLEWEERITVDPEVKEALRKIAERERNLKNVSRNIEKSRQRNADAIQRAEARAQALNKNRQVDLDIEGVENEDSTAKLRI